VEEKNLIRVLLIDDEPFSFKMMGPIFQEAGYQLEYARNGNEGLTKMPVFQPEVIILDVRLPDMTGFDIIERIRSDAHFDSVPVIFVSGQIELNDKLRAFELGADDYLEKPFQTQELVARMGILARRSKAIKIVKDSQPVDITATVVAVHSLRGGVGCSTIAVNLALGLYQLWQKSTLLIDAVLHAGQVALMMNSTPAITWEEMAGISTAEIDPAMITQLANAHKTGIRYVASPRFPIATDSFAEGFFDMVMQHYVQGYEYIVVDTTHDFSDITMEMLTVANQIIMVMSPEMASLRAALCAMNIYAKMGFAQNKIKVLLNNTTNVPGIKTAQIEKVLGQPVDFVLPYAANEVARAINFGDPFMLATKELPIRSAIEDIAYMMSNKVHKNIPPAAPTAAWKRVNKRFPDKK
jgi:pilus assembly protein CpaE